MEITATKLFKEYNSSTVFDDVSFTIAYGEKIGLVGYNGTGKSTLLKIIAGCETADSGTIKIPKNIVVGYVPQDTLITTDETILDYINRAMREARGETYEVQQYKIEAILDGFGIRDIDLHTKLAQLSSGQKVKVFLTAALITEPDVLLLDEPTNNLDLISLIWLENFLKNTKMACVIVSHDRKFLDSIVNTIFEIDWNTRNLTITHGKYSDFLKRAQKERERQKVEYKNQQEEAKRIQNLVRKSVEHAERGMKYTQSDNDKYSQQYFRDRSKKTGKKIQAYKSRLEQMEGMEKPVERRELTIDIGSEKSGGVKSIELHDVVAGYKNGFQIGPLSLNINFGDRVVLLGDNGAGKSTLLKTILGKIEPLAGEIKIGSATKIADFTQEHENLPKDKTLFDFLSQSENLRTHEVYNLARKYGFAEGEIKKPLGYFSPGGRARILFALFSVQSVNVLFLDEPTNHLDMEAVEALEGVIKNYKGTIVLISHDRHLLDIINPTTLLLISSDGSIQRQSDLHEYIEQAQKRAERLGRII